jgi:hypothetical protein
MQHAIFVLLYCIGLGIHEYIFCHTPGVRRPIKSPYCIIFYIKGVPNGMKGLFEGLSLKNGKSYKLLSSMTGMIETLAAIHMILKVLLQ